MINKNTEKISALLISYNEEKNILRFLEEAAYADEIIIVDSYSTDKTEFFAKQNSKVKFVKRKFDNFANQRNYALSLAENEWVTFFDADEVVSDKLSKEILFTINNNPKCNAYYVYRKFFFKKKYVRFTGMQNDKTVRLFKKSGTQYRTDLLVHEQLEFKGEIGILKNKVDHYTFDSEEEYQEKLNKYSKLRAEELYLKKMKPTIVHYYLKPAYKFFHHYFIRLGFLDGEKGFTISKIHSKSIINRYKYLDDMYAAEVKDINK